MYAGLYQTCGQFPVGIQSRPQYFASSILLINFFGFPLGSVGYYETIRYEYLRTVLLIDTTSSTTSLLHHEVVGAKKDAIATQYD